VPRADAGGRGGGSPGGEEEVLPGETPWAVETPTPGGCRARGGNGTLGWRGLAARSAPGAVCAGRSLRVAALKPDEVGVEQTCPVGYHADDPAKRAAPLGGPARTRAAALTLELRELAHVVSCALPLGMGRPQRAAERPDADVPGERSTAPAVARVGGIPRPPAPPPVAPALLGAGLGRDRAEGAGGRRVKAGVAYLSLQHLHLLVDCPVDDPVSHPVAPRAQPADVERPGVGSVVSVRRPLRVTELAMIRASNQPLRYGCAERFPRGLFLWVGELVDSLARERTANSTNAPCGIPRRVASLPRSRRHSSVIQKVTRSFGMLPPLSRVASHAYNVWRGAIRVKGNRC